jgi:hypothetical protein
MYVSQHAFTPAPAKFDQWVPYNRNDMSLSARVPGAVLSRILRLKAEPEKFMAVGVWTSRDTAVQWTESDESKLGAKPSVDLGLYEGYPMTWTRWDLVDFAWGLEGPAQVAAGSVIRHVAWEAGPGPNAVQDAFLRATLSILAREPGFICGETHRGHRGDRYQMLYTFEAAAELSSGGSPPAELQLLLESDAIRDLRAKTPAADITDTTVWEWVWGPDAGRLPRIERTVEALGTLR